MNNRAKLFFHLLALTLCLGWLEGYSQCDSTATIASGYMNDSFVSDGQSYRALLFNDQVAEFETTFYGNSTYRISGIAGFESGQVLFSLYDEENNLLFSNETFENSPYWDFEIESTIKCRIEAKLDQVKQKSGCAVLLIGFER